MAVAGRGPSGRSRDIGLSSGLRPWSAELEFVARLSRPAPTQDDTARARSLAIDGLNWTRVINTAISHGVAALVDTHLRRAMPSEVPAGVDARLRSAWLSAARNDLAMHERWLVLHAAFAECGIRAVTVNGFHAVHLLYGQVGLRPVEQLDLLVGPDDVHAAIGVLRDLGFRPWRDVETAIRNVGLGHLVRSATSMTWVSGTEGMLRLNWEVQPSHRGRAAEDVIASAEPFHVDEHVVLAASPATSVAMLLLHTRRDTWHRLCWLVDTTEWLDRLSPAEYAGLVGAFDARGMGATVGNALTLIESLWGRLPAVCLAGVTARPRHTADAVRESQSSLERNDGGQAAARSRRPWHKNVPHRLRTHTAGAALATALRPTYSDWAFVALPRALRPAYYLVRPLRLLRELVDRLTSRWNARAVHTWPQPADARREVAPYDGSDIVDAPVDTVAWHQPPAGTPLTFVTAIYGDGRDSTDVARAHGLEDCLPSLINIANLGAPIVVFCPPRDVEHITAALATHFHAYHVVPFHQLAIKPFATFAAWEMSYEGTLTAGAGSAPIGLLKSHMLQQAAQENPFGHDLYFWIDARMTHHGIFPTRVGGVRLGERPTASRYHPERTENIFTPRLGAALARVVQRGTVTFCALPFTESASRARFESVAAAAFDRTPGSVHIRRHLVGVMFGGYAWDLAIMHAGYVRLLRAMVDAKTDALDEQIFSTLCALQPEHFSLLHFDSWRHDVDASTHPAPPAGTRSFSEIFTRLVAATEERPSSSTDGDARAVTLIPGIQKKRIRIYLGASDSGNWFSEFVRCFCRDFVEPAFDVDYATPVAQDLATQGRIHLINGRQTYVHAYVAVFEGGTSGTLRVMTILFDPIAIFRDWNFDPERVDRVLTGHYVTARLRQRIRAQIAHVGWPRTLADYERQWRPGIYGQYRWGLVEAVREEPAPVRTRGLYFRGLYSSWRATLDHLDEFAQPGDQLNVDSWQAGAPGQLPPREHLHELRRHAIALSLPGAGDICNRDFECLGLGVPLLRPVFATEFARPLVPGVHYIGVPYEHAGPDETTLPPDRPKDPRQLAHDLLATYRQVRDNADLLHDIARRGREYYDQNCSYPACAQLALELLDLESL